MQGTTRPHLPWEDVDVLSASDPLTSFENAHDLMITVLNHQMFQFNKYSLQRIAIDSVDDEITLEEFFQSIDKQHDESYTKLLAAYSGGSVHSFSAILQSLIAWRKRTMLDWTSWSELGCTNTDSRVQLLMDEKKINATDYLFCKILMILLSSWEKHNSPTDDVILDTIETAFSSIKSLSKQKDIKEPEGIVANRRDVLEMFAHLIGKISSHRFDFVVDRFYHEIDRSMEAGAASIPETVSLLSGIRYLRLSITTADDLAKAQQFLDFLSKYISKKTKPELLAGFCEAYGDILLPLSDCVESEGVDYSNFREHITEMFYSTKKLWKKLKEPTPGLIMEVGILCNGKKDFLAQQPFSVLERLSKVSRLSDKNRPNVLDCTYYLLMTMFSKYDNPNYDISFDLILEKISREMFPPPSKKVVIPQLESVDAFVDIVSLLSIFRLDYSVKSFVHGAVSSSDSNYERILAGMKIFNAIADRVAVSFDKTNLMNRTSNIDYSNRKASLERCSKTFRPSHLSTESIDRFRNDLEQVLLLVDSQVGDLLLYNQPQDRKLTDYDIARVKYLPKEKQPLIFVLRTCIDCIRRVPPASIEISKLILMLSKYCFHLDTEVRLQARKLLLGTLKTKPSYRSILVEVFATFIVHMPDSQPNYIHKGVEILLELLSAWHDPIVLNAIDPDLDFFVIPGKISTTFPAGILEGCALNLLCSPHLLVRNDGFQILEWTKRVNEGLPRDICDPTPGVNMILQENEKEILTRIDNDPTLLSAETMDSLLPAHLHSVSALMNSSNQDELQTIIVRCIGEIVRAIRPNCNKSLQVAFTFASDKLDALNSIITNAKRGDTPGFNEQLMLWRNYSIIVGGSGSLGSEGIARITAVLSSPLQNVRDSSQYVLYYMNTSSIVIVSSQIVSEAKKKKDFLRLELAHVFRVICDKRVFESKDRNVVTRCMEFFQETANFLSSLTEAQWHLQLYLSYDLFRCSALFFEYLKKNQKKLSELTVSTQLREILFNQGIRYSGFGTYRSEQKLREQKIKELCPPDKLKDAEKHLQYMQYWAIRSLNAVMCQGAEEFTTPENVTEAGPVFSLVTDIFENCDSRKLLDIVVALIKELINSSPARQESMFQLCIDKSFNLSSIKISQGYFITVVDIITSNIDTTCKLPELLTLAIYKLSDNDFHVRKAAVKMLHWMSTRFFRTSEDTFKLLRSAGVDDTYSNQMIQTAKFFSAKHPELRIEILREAMNRLGHIDRTGQRRMIQIIDAWFSGTNFAEFDEDSLSEIFQHFTVFTHNHGEQRPDILESLWRGFTIIHSNVALMMKFMSNNVLDRQKPIMLNVFRKIATILTRYVPNEVQKILLEELNSPADYGALLHNKISISDEISAAWVFDNIFPLKQMQVPLTRRSFAMIIISDVINENFQGFTNHFPKVLNAVFVEMDTQNPVVSSFAKILLENIVHRHVSLEEKENSESDKAMKELFAVLDRSEPQVPLWPNESVTLQSFEVPSAIVLAEVAQLVLKALSSCTGLREDWAASAIKWAVHDTSVHVTARCLQLYRALSPSLSNNVLHSIIAKLLQSIQTRSPINVQISIEIMETLKVVPKSTPREVLLEIPQLFWTAAAMLNTVICQEFCSAVQLTSALVDRMKIHTIEAQKSLLATIPQSWTPTFQGIIIFLLKGLCSPKTELVSRMLLARISDLPCIYPFHVDKDLRVLGNIIGLCPHLLTGMGRGDTFIVSDNLATGLLYFGEGELSKLFRDYPKFTTSAEGMRRFIHELGHLLADKFFPTHELFVFNVLVEMMENGPPAHQRSILSLLEVFLSCTDLQHSTLNSTHLSLLAPAMKHFNGPYWQEALTVMKVVLDKSSDHSKQKAYKTIPPKEDLDQLQVTTATWERFANIEPLTKALLEALEPRVNPNPPEPFIPEQIPEDSLSRSVGRGGNIVRQESLNSPPATPPPKKHGWGGIKPSNLQRESSSKNIGASRKMSQPCAAPEEKSVPPLDNNVINEVKKENNINESPLPPPRESTPPRPIRPNRTQSPAPRGSSEFRAPLPSIGRNNTPNSPARGIRGPGPPRGRGNPRGNLRGNPRGRPRGS